VPRGVQNGAVGMHRGKPTARWYDEHGRDRRKSSFATLTEARVWLNKELKRVERMRGSAAAGRFDGIPTLADLIDEFLMQYAGETNSKATLLHRLKHVTGGKNVPRAGFADLRVDRLTMPTLAAWRAKLPAGSAWHIYKALRQVLNYGVAAGYLDRNVAAQVANPEPRRTPVSFFGTTAEIDLLARHMPDLVSAAAVVVGSELGPRTEEWIALERGDVDRRAGLIHVRRVFVDGEVRDRGKTPKSLRTIPLTERALTALDSLPPRLDTPLLFPDPLRGVDRWCKGCGCPTGETTEGCRNCRARRHMEAIRPRRERLTCNRCVGPCLHIRLNRWRAEVFDVALEAAGLHVDDYGRDLKRTPYSLRHTYATWMLAAGVPVSDVADYMGTSVKELERTYRHRHETAPATAAAALAQFQARAAVPQSVPQTAAGDFPAKSGYRRPKR
jgi:integrase